MLTRWPERLLLPTPLTLLFGCVLTLFTLYDSDSMISSEGTTSLTSGLNWCWTLPSIVTFDCLDNDDDILVYSTFSGMRCGADYDFYLVSILNIKNDYKLANYIYAGGKSMYVLIADSLIYKNNTLEIPSLHYRWQNGYFDSLRTSIVTIDNGVLIDIMHTND